SIFAAVQGATTENSGPSQGKLKSISKIATRPAPIAHVAGVVQNGIGPVRAMYFGGKAMTKLRLFGITVAASLIAGIASTRAQDASAAYTLAYIEVAPSSARSAVAVLRELRDAGRKEAGNKSFEVLQRIGQPRQFAILEVWSDAKAQANHAAAA